MARGIRNVIGVFLLLVAGTVAWRMTTHFRLERALLARQHYYETIAPQARRLEAVRQLTAWNRHAADLLERWHQAPGLETGMLADIPHTIPRSMQLRGLEAQCLPRTEHPPTHRHWQSTLHLYGCITSSQPDFVLAQWMHRMNSKETLPGFFGHITLDFFGAGEEHSPSKREQVRTRDFSVSAMHDHVL